MSVYICHRNFMEYHFMQIGLRFVGSPQNQRNQLGHTMMFQASNDLWIMQICVFKALLVRRKIMTLKANNIYKKSLEYLFITTIQRSKPVLSFDIWEFWPRTELITATDPDIRTCAFLNCFSNCKTLKIDVPHFFFLKISIWWICSIFPCRFLA